MEVVKRDNLMSESEFEDYIKNGIMFLRLSTFYGVGVHKSIRRAIRRGHVTTEGYVMPNRPFNNKRNSCKRGKHSRAMNEEKKRIYAGIREYQRRHSD